MCGLVGMAGILTHVLRTQGMKDFLDVCQVRGRDSTGVIKINRRLAYDWVKAVGPPFNLYDGRSYERRIEQGGESCILIGHTRKKTMGEISVKNAHPFDYPDEGICGVHNGTLRSYYDLDTYDREKVDSEVLYGHLAKNGPKDTFGKIEGAFACVWWNDEDKTLNFIRNDERPLWFTWSKDMKAMFWASEPWMFGAIARLEDLWDGGKDGKVYINLPPRTLWTFKINPEAKGDDKVITMKTALSIPQEKKVYLPTYGRTNGYPENGTVSRPSSEWYQAENGDWHRRSDDEFRKGQEKGGEVPDPFRLAGDVPTPAQIRTRLRDRLLSNLNESVVIPEDLSNLEISNVRFLTRSAQNSDLSTESNSTKKSGRNILSLPGRNSSNNRQKNSVDLSGAGGQSETKSAVQRLKTGVSFRSVIGVHYITDNNTKTEYTLAEVTKKFGSACVFCKSPIQDVFQIGDLIKDTIICSECLLEDNIPFPESATK